ncbi:hypothetical protein ACX4MT_20145 [Roseomonas mucosa]
MAGNTLRELAEFVGSFENWSLDVEFDPGDLVSVEAAIQAMEAEIDAKAARYGANPAVLDAAERMKDEYREVIRAQKHDDDDESDPGEEP